MGLRKMMYVIVIFLLVISIVYIPGFVGEGHGKVLYQEDVDRMLNEGNYDFSYCEFKEDINFNSITFEKEVSFRGAIFDGELTFSNVVFENEASFKNVTFGNLTISENNKFSKKVDFTDSAFEGHVYFKENIFEAPVFFNANFNSSASFYKVTFKDLGMFSGVIFEGETGFREIQFKKGATFTQAVFEEDTIFWEKEDSEYPMFEGRAEFEKATFEGEIRFENVTFGYASFKNTEFKNKVTFYKGKFCGGADFSNSLFEDYTYFSETIFGENSGEDICFSHVTFIGETTFYKTLFNLSTLFESTYFKGDTYFYSVVFRDTAVFNRFKFEQIFDFNTIENSKIDLRFFKGFGYGQIKADLTKTMFYGAYLQNVNFIDCTWSKPFMIYEESEEYKESCSKWPVYHWELEYKELETIYRNLKNSFTKYGQSDLAGKAFYREMEMKKLRAKEEGKCLLKCWYWFLKWSCGYGEKPLRIIGWDIGIIVFFAGLFLTCGIDIKNRRKYNLSLSDWVKYFFYCCLFSISSSTTLGSKYITPRNKKSKFFSVFESLIGAFFIALFIYVFARKMLR